MEQSHLAVRVQDDLHGLFVDEQGAVHLNYQSDTLRNTCHFSINGVVEDHIYGTFNENKDGSLKGKIVIVTPLEQMPEPAGLGQQDSWWRYQAQQQPDGSWRRTLNVGEATLIVPQGVSVPPGINVITYDGSVEGRNQAVAQHFEQQGVAMQSISNWGWSGQNVTEHTQWREHVAKTYFPNANIHLGAHTGSPDEKVESIFHSGLGEMSLSQMCKTFEADKKEYYRNDSQVDMPYMHTITQKYEQGLQDLTSLQQSFTPQQQQAFGNFYQHLEQKAHSIYAKAQSVQQEIEHTNALKDQCYDDCRKALADLPYTGNVYIAQNAQQVANKEYLNMNKRDFASYLVYGQEDTAPATEQTLVWMQGMSQWQPISQTPELHKLYEKSQSWQKQPEVTPNMTPPPPSDKSLSSTKVDTPLSFPQTQPEALQSATHLSFDAKSIDILANLEQYRADRKATQEANALPTSPRHKNTLSA